MIPARARQCVARLVTLLATVVASGDVARSQTATAQVLSPSYAVVIGISDYARSNLWPRLDTGVPDARAVQDLLRQQGFVVTSLLGTQATRASIVSTLRTLARKIEADRSSSARVVVYFAGHGTTETVAGTDYGYLVPYDGTNDSSSYVSMDDLREVSQRLRTARHQLYLLDSCFGGLLVTRGQASGVDAGQPGYLQDAIKRKAIQVLTAGGKDQQVVSNGPGGHSPFAGALLEALGQGLADTRKDGVISFNELVNYIIPRASNRYQTPGYGTLPGHGLGEFLFRSPAPRTASPPAAPPLGTSPVLRSPDSPPPDPAKPSATVSRSDIRRLETDCTDGNVDACRQQCAASGISCVELGDRNAAGKTDSLLKEPARARWYYEAACAGGAAEGCQKACDAGAHQSCATIAGFYSTGDAGLTRDASRAGTLYKKACEGGLTESCQKGCDLGVADSCASLGTRYERGQGGVTTDVARAIALYRQACDGGSGAGCTSLGLRYALGEGGLAKDVSRATQLFDKACTSSNGDGCGYLGAQYEEGAPGLRKDKNRAVSLYQKSCDLGNLDGCEQACRLGRADTCNVRGLRHLSDPKGGGDKAVEWFQQACDKKSPDGCDNLGTTTRDELAAQDAFEKSCRLGNMSGCDHLGVSLQKVRSSGGYYRDADSAAALKAYEKACTGKNASGCFHVGAMYERGALGVPAEVKEARIASMFDKACELGGPDACSDFGARYQGDPDNVVWSDGRFELAARLHRKACERGAAVGCARLGAMYAKGDLGPKNLPAGIEFYRKACDLGRASACYDAGSSYYYAGDGLLRSDRAQALEFYRKACALGLPSGCSQVISLTR